jgi:hypothetical protein
LLILSETKEELQHSLDNLSNYCDNWQLAINVNKLNNVGFHESPCLTPLEMSKKTECWSLCFKDDVVLRYCSFNNLKKCNPTPILHNLYKSASLQTESNNQIQNVSEYPFFDITLKSNGNLSHSIIDLVKKAKKALFCIKSYTTSLNNLPVKVVNNLFDTLVKPIMTYNSEVTYLDTLISLYKAKKRASTKYILYLIVSIMCLSIFK